MTTRQPDNRVLFDGPSDSPRRLILAHGAGGAMDTPFLNIVARGLAERGIRVIRFEFPYMRRRREEGKRTGAPDRQPVLVAAWREAIDAFREGGRLVIGGKSLGGRIASMVADEAGVAGLLCLGYPFHPPGDPSRLRTAHLESLRTPTLIVQGERDPFGRREEIGRYKLSNNISFLWMTDGDHSLKPRAASGVTERENLARAVDEAASFVYRLD